MATSKTDRVYTMVIVACGHTGRYATQTRAAGVRLWFYVDLLFICLLYVTAETYHISISIINMCVFVYRFINGIWCITRMSEYIVHCPTYLYNFITHKQLRRAWSVHDGDAPQLPDADSGRYEHGTGPKVGPSSPPRRGLEAGAIARPRERLWDLLAWPSALSWTPGLALAMTGHDWPELAALVLVREVSAAKTPLGVAAPPFDTTASAVHYKSLRGISSGVLTRSPFVKFES